MSGRSEEVRVEIHGLSKTFPGTRALKKVDLDVRAGEIHALVGGNGSGKSTLIKILTGIHHGDDGGSIRIGTTEVAPSNTSPDIAAAASVHAVHQDLGVFPALSVMENIALGYGYATVGKSQVRWRALRARTERLLDRFEIDARPGTPMDSLSQATRTQVAIARALQAEEEGGEHAGLLILDEPTASLPAHEVGLLQDILRRYASRGQAILYVSHRLDEVLALCDRVSILRDGAMVGTYETSDLDEDALIKLIVGREIDRFFPSMPEVVPEKPVLEIKNLNVAPLRDVSFSVRPGEIVGLGGLLGSGRTELLRAIFGDLRTESGTILLDGEELNVRRPSQAMAKDIAMVPEDRASDAAFLDMPIWANVGMASISKYWKAGFMRGRRMRSDADGAMDEFLVKAPSEKALLATLSGGNQQKVILARWLRRKPRVLLLDEPTQGVDVNARAEIYNLIKQAVTEGAGAILVASDLEELAHVSDRVVVLSAGRVVAEMSREHLSAERLTQAAYNREAVQ
ncbi:MAG: sugar ABC transporter ATP-binding protein [Solirubrobacterales bacterium]